MEGDLSRYDSLVDDPLHAAIRESDLRAVSALLKTGHDPNVENFDGMVPLSTLAWSSGSIEIARLLLDAGADPDGSRTPLPPLVQAASQGRRELVLLLMNSGADPNIVDEDEYTALMYSLIRKDCDLALQILSFGASPLGINRYGRDARSYAEEAGCQEVTERIDELLSR